MKTSRQDIATRSRAITASVLLAVLTLATGLRAQASSALVWDRTNPGGGGWFERCAAGPTGLVIACSDLGGAYVSHDRGKTWHVRGAIHGLTTTHTSCVAFHPQDAEIVYLGSEDGIFTSSALATRFTHTLKGGYVESIGVSPSDARVAYAAVHTRWNANTCHVYKTLDSGRSWQRVDRSFPPRHRCIEVLVDPIDPQQVYALTGEGRFARGPKNVFASYDGGVTWTAIGGGFGDRVVDIAIDPHASDELFASVDDADKGQLGHLHKSEDGGKTWRALARRSGFVWVDRARPGTLRMVEARFQYPWDEDREGIWESNRGGRAGSWHKVGSVRDWKSAWSTAYWAFGSTSNYGGFGEDYSDPDALYWVNGQFAFATFDRGRHVLQSFSTSLGRERWRSRGFDNVVPADVSLHRGASLHVYAGFFDIGAWRSLDGGASWSPINDKKATGNWEGAGGNTFSILADPAVSGAVWSLQGPEHDGIASLLFSAEYGSSWTRVGEGLPRAPTIGLSLDPRSPAKARHLFVSAGGDIYGSVDHGKSWTRRTRGRGLRFTHVDRSTSSRVFAGGEGGLFVSTQAGRPSTWREIGGPDMRGTRRGLPASGWSGVLDIATHKRLPGTQSSPQCGARAAAGFGAATTSGAAGSACCRTATCANSRCHDRTSRP